MTTTTPPLGMDPEQSFLQALRELGAWHDKNRDQLPSDRALARTLRASATTVGKWLDGRQVPQQPERLLELVDHLRGCAVTSGIELPEPADLLDRDAWRQRQEAVHTHRAQVVSEGVLRSQSLAALADGERRARYVALPDKPRPLAQWTAAQLGVHPAVAGRPAPAVGFVLPDYVDRPHDEELRGRLTAAATGSDSAMMVVRGPSCAGKTRTAYEAVRACLPDWRLVFPKGPDSLLALLAADALAPRTVLWLNEAQEFLLGPAGDAAAAALRRRLEQPGPMVVLATLWPEYHQALTATPAASAEDPHSHARALLTALPLVEVPANFTAAVVTRLRTSSDASLAIACQTSSERQVTQTLAAGPQLVDHWLHPVGPGGVYGSALITAAMDARRLGCGPAVPLSFLEAAASGYLTDQQRASAADDWFTHALAYARSKVKGVAAALNDVPRHTGMGAVPGVCALADYLDHHARSSRRFQVPPDSFWDAALQHAESIGGEGLLALGVGAEKRWRLRRASQLYSRAADTGSSEALLALGRLRLHTRHDEEAERLFRQAGDAGSPDALVHLAEQASEAGDVEEAARLYRMAADAGSGRAWGALVKLRIRKGGVAAGEETACQAAQAGYPGALDHLVGPHTPLDSETTTRMVRIASDTGRHGFLCDLARRWHQHGDPAEAERLYRIAGEAGSYAALRDLASLCEDADRHGEAEEFARQAAVSPHALRGRGRNRSEHRRWPAGRGPLQELAHRRAEAGDRSEAERLYQAAADVGDPDALRYVARRKEAAGDFDGAARLYEQATDAHYTQLRRSLLPFITDEGREILDDHSYWQEIQASRALRDLAVMNERADNADEANRLHRLADGRATGYLLRLRIDAEQWPQAEEIAQESAQAGDTGPLRRLAAAFQEDGDLDQTARLYQQAADAGDTSAATALVGLMRRTWGPSRLRPASKPNHRQPPAPEDLTKAEALARRNADAGEGSLLRQLTRSNYPVPDWKRIYQHGLEADGSISAPW
ncbi:sel1 repeat family protein [Streptomyces sp. NBC_00090]|uniref:tetratricopeptide repeat protein n=1 Tax=Streptomyces sp. NBC_00090 TaxID=2903619 RepID=UPI0032462D1D